MRLLLTLQARRAFPVSLHYQQYLSAAIYQLVNRASSQHATWMHDRGYTYGKRIFKHFTFSRLFFPQSPKIQDGRIIISGRFQWLLSFYAETTLLQLIIGMMEERTFHIGQANNEVRIIHVEILEEPSLTDQMRFICLSPVLIKKPNASNGKLHAEYLMPDHPEVSLYLSKNLVNKYRSIFPEEKTIEDGILFLPDQSYIERRGGKVSKLIRFKQGTQAETTLRAFECPFSLKGNPKLIHIAYECGLGDNNAMGFGMIEIARKDSGYEEQEGYEK